MKDNKFLTADGMLINNQSLFHTIITDLPDYVHTHFIDIDYSEDTNKNGLYYGVGMATISPDIVKKTITLKKVPIQITTNKMDDIILHLQREYIEIVKEHGLKNRENGLRNGINFFDIDLTRESINISDLTDDEFKTVNNRKIYTKITGSSNFIATYGRIGYIHYIIASEKNTDLLIEIFPNKSFTIIQDKELDDETLILGRKNEFSTPGVLLILNENSLQNIVYNEIGESYVNLIYSFASLGYHPENQFLTLKIKK